MSQGLRPLPAARLVLAMLPTMIAIAWLPGPCLGGPPPLPDHRLGMRQAPLLLLTRPDIRASVGLDETQAADAERTLTELYQRALSLKGKRDRESEAGRRAIDAAGEQWLKTRLSDAQRKRLIELDLQWEGPSALITRPVVADHLRLTPEQRTRLAEAIAECNRRRAEGGDYRECVHQLAQKALSLLTTEQSTRWKAMLGPPFPFVPQLASSRTTTPH
jgi:hypothetical protein